MSSEVLQKEQHFLVPHHHATIGTTGTIGIVSKTQCDQFLQLVELHTLFPDHCHLAEASSLCMTFYSEDYLSLLSFSNDFSKIALNLTLAHLIS